MAVSSHLLLLDYADSDLEDSLLELLHFTVIYGKEFLFGRLDLLMPVLSELHDNWGLGARNLTA